MRSGLRELAFALAPLTAAALWGGMFVVSEWSFDSLPPLTLAFFRVALGAAVLLPVVRFRGERLPRSEWRTVAGLAGWVSLTMAAQFVGTDLTNASQGSLVTILTPVATVALGALVLGETVSRRRTTGVALAVVGTVVVLAGQYDLSSLAGGSLLGIVGLVVASVAWAAYTVYGTPLVREYSALTTTAYSVAASVPMMAVLAAGELAVVGLPALPGLGVLAAVGYLGIAATAAAWYLWYRGIETVDAGTVAVFFFAQPVVGTVLGVLLLGESVGSEFLAGGTVMAVGIWVVSTEAD
ncbi:DMT family transporter [Haloarchaeobius sp. HME9146]|uniref:DMT family transporter n=1 Tax=Haloarchaeobius sp. HME9146 TaxID=2978732 RepID=UPI0021C1DBC5|nr:EamA family transporter [Haloarchaeobius sp. HME9146]MCT9096750.1 EamA family transporter [Haloarchaeobius sp. HME9146]